MPNTLRDRELARFERSGWSTLAEVEGLLAARPTELLAKQAPRWWRSVAVTIGELENWLAGKRFADDVEVGLLYVPATATLDTRQPINGSVRTQQRTGLDADVFDERLGVGTDLVGDNRDGAFFVTCVGAYGVAVGSYDDVRQAPAADYMLGAVDLRTAMTRQLWGARVLQAGNDVLPDSEDNATWTFTLFPGDQLCDGMAPSGTILKSRVRFRLGKANRGIGSARVAPALPVPR